MLQKGTKSANTVQRSHSVAAVTRGEARGRDTCQLKQPRQFPNEKLLFYYPVNVLLTWLNFRLLLDS